MPVTDVALLLAAQTAGGLVSNPAGRWGDRVSKRNLLEAAAVLAVVPPILGLDFLTIAGAMAWIAPWFAVIFFIMGPVTSGSRPSGQCAVGGT